MSPRDSAKPDDPEPDRQAGSRRDRREQTRAQEDRPSPQRRGVMSIRHRGCCQARRTTDRRARFVDKYCANHRLWGVVSVECFLKLDRPGNTSQLLTRLKGNLIEIDAKM